MSDKDKELMQHYLTALGEWEQGLAAFFEDECPAAPKGGVRVLLTYHRDTLAALERIVDNLPNNQ